MNTQEAFLSAASPGVDLVFFHNGHYPSRGGLSLRVAEAMRGIRDRLREAGYPILQIDCPDSLIGPAHPIRRLSLAEFCKKARLHIEALNHALANIPADRCACTSLGQLREARIIAMCRWRHHRDRFLAKPSGLSFEAANPRHAHEWRFSKT